MSKEDAELDALKRKVLASLRTEPEKLCPHGRAWLTCTDLCPLSACDHPCALHDCWGVRSNLCSDPDCDCEWPPTAADGQQ